MARILIVDDEESIRLYQGTVLETAGHEVFFARSGEEGMRAFLRKKVDVVITDLHMAFGDGLELIEALIGIDPDAVIIAVSGTGPELLGTARTIGAQATLPKPVTPTDLVRAVDEVLGSVLPAGRS